METKNEQLAYIPMYKSYIDAVSRLSAEDRLTIYEAIFEFGFTGVEPTFDNPYLEMGWNLVKPNLLNNMSRVKSNQENGKKGGRPKQELAKKAPKALSTKSEEVILEVKEVLLESIFETDTSIIEEIEEKSFLESLEEYGDEDDEDIVKKDIYSEITFKTFLIKEKHLAVWYFIQSYKGVMSRLSNNNTQIQFDIVMNKIYDDYKDKVN